MIDSADDGSAMWEVRERVCDGGSWGHARFVPGARAQAESAAAIFNVPVGHQSPTGPAPTGIGAGIWRMAMAGADRLQAGSYGRVCRGSAMSMNQKKKGKPKPRLPL